MKKRIFALILALSLMLSLASCMKSGLNGADKTYTIECMTVTLTDGFKPVEYEGYTACFDSTDVAVFCLKESFDLAEGFGDYTLEQYAALVAQANADKNPTTTTESGIPVLEYTFHNEELDITYGYMIATYKCGDAFWMVQFACEESAYADSRDTFVRWASSVTFAD